MGCREKAPHGPRQGTGSDPAGKSKSPWQDPLGFPSSTHGSGLSWAVASARGSRAGSRTPEGERELPPARQAWCKPEGRGLPGMALQEGAPAPGRRWTATTGLPHRHLGMQHAPHLPCNPQRLAPAQCLPAPAGKAEGRPCSRSTPAQRSLQPEVHGSGLVPTSTQVCGKGRWHGTGARLID